MHNYHWTLCSLKNNKAIKNKITVTKTIPSWGAIYSNFGSANEPKKKLITAYIMKDCAMAIFFWIKTMMNVNKIVRLAQSVWWTIYYARKLQEKSMTEHT